MPEPVARQSLVDKVYQHLTAQIACKQLDVGDRLNSRQIATQLHVSRTTVNKAVERLVSDGWVGVDESRHTIVVALPRRLKIHEESEFEFANQTDTAYEQLLDRILRGEFGIGDVLKERPVASEMGFNPATLRRAAEWLSRDGLLERLPRRGWRVTLLTVTDIRETYSIRLLLEPLIMSGVVHCMTDDQIDELEADTRRLIDMGEKATVFDRRNADYYFHQKLCEASGKRILAKTLDPLIRKVLLITTVGFRYGRASRSFEEHEKILAAIRSRDEKAAINSIKAHLRNAKKFNLEVWEGH